MLKDDIKKLAGKRRSRKNLEAIQEQLTELEELAESVETASQAANNVKEYLQELSDALEDLPDDNPLLSWAADAREPLTTLLAVLPDEDETLSELVSEAQEAASEYETAQDDPDYDADDREEAWGALVNALDNIAEAL